MKPSSNELGGDFFKVAHDSDLDSTFYTARYRANVKEAHMKKIVKLHQQDAKYLYVSDTDDSQSSDEEKYFINILVLFSKLVCFYSSILYVLFIQHQQGTTENLLTPYVLLKNPRYLVQL